MGRKLQFMSGFAALLCMFLLWVAPVKADEDGLYIAGVKVTYENCNDLSVIDGVTVASGGEFKYAPSTNTLTMKDVTVNVGDDKNAILNRIRGTLLTIVVSGTNRLQSTNLSALYVTYYTSIDGDGTLIAVRGSDGDASAVYVDDMSLFVENITLEASGACGIRGRKSRSCGLSLSNTTITAKGEKGAIVDFDGLSMSGCIYIYPMTARHVRGSVLYMADAQWKTATEVKIVPGEAYDLYIGGAQVTSANCNDLSVIDGVTVASGGEFKYDSSTKTLTMKDVTVNVGDDKNAILNSMRETPPDYLSLKIAVSGTNRLQSTNLSALCVTYSTSIDGDGTLIAVRGSDGDASAIFVGYTSLMVSNITLEASGAYGIKGRKDSYLNLTNTTITAKGKKGAIVDFYNFSMSGCIYIYPMTARHVRGSVLYMADAQWKTATEVKIVPGEAYDLYIGGAQVTSANCNDLSVIDGVTVASGGEFKYDPTTKTLTMKDVTVEVVSLKTAIYSNVDGLKINVSGTNKLYAVEEVLYVDQSMSIQGNGTLSVNAKGGGALYIYSDSKLTISDITLDISTKRESTIYGYGKVDLINATVTMKTEEGDVTSSARITLKDCAIVSPAGGHFASGYVLDREGNRVKEVTIKPSVTYALWINDTQVTSLNCNDLSIIGGVTVAPGGEFKYDPSTSTLTMKDVTVDKEILSKLRENGRKSPKIVVSGTNKLECLRMDDHACMLIEGSGTLITKKIVVDWSSTLTISDIILNTGCMDGSSDSILILKNATVTASNSDGAIIEFGRVRLEGCEIVTPEGGWYSENRQALVNKAGELATRVEIKPVVAYDLFIAGNQVTEHNWNDLSGIKGVTVAPGGALEYNPSSKTLTMKDVTVKVGDGKTPIENVGVDGLKIVVSGTNKLEVTNYSAMWVKSATSIEGDGTLTAESDNGEYGDYAMRVSNTILTISDITLKVTGRRGIGGYDDSRGTLVLKNATVTAKGKLGAFTNLAAFTTEGCAIVAPDGCAFDATKHAVVDEKGNPAGIVKIEKRETPPLPSASFAINPTTLAEVSATGGAQSVALTSNKGWTLALEPTTTDWVTPSATSGTGDATITFDVAKNEIAEPRTVTITITQAETNKTLSLTLTQMAKGAVNVPLTGLAFTQTELPIRVGGTTSLAAFLQFQPANATNKNVTWAVTEGEASLEVDATGKITATQTPGVAVVTATSVDGGHTATCTVNVIAGDVPVSSISLSPTTVNLAVGATQQLTVSVKPTTATHKSAMWSVTSGTGVVTVDGSGKVTAVATGSAVVTATVGGKTATCSITVTPATAVENPALATLSVSPNPFTTQLRIANPEGLEARYEVVTLSGKVVRSGVLTSETTIVGTETLPAGLYFVRLSAQNGAQRVVKVVCY